MILGVSEGWLSDRIKMRSPFFFFNSFLQIIGVCLLGFAQPTGARYFGAFITVGGGYANIPLAITFQNNNIRGQWKRGFSAALIVAGGGMGGIVGSLVFRSKDAPAYRYVYCNEFLKIRVLINHLLGPVYILVSLLRSCVCCQWEYWLHITTSQTRNKHKAKRLSKEIQFSAICIRTSLWELLS
jgi:hypothetical protein